MTYAGARCRRTCRRRRALVLWPGSLGLLAAALEGIGLYLFIPLAQSLSSSSSQHPLSRLSDRLLHPIPPENRTLVLIGFVCLVIVLKNAAGLAGAYPTRYGYGTIAHELRMRIFEQALWSGVDYRPGVRLANIAETVASNTWKAGNAVTIVFRAMIAGCTLAVFMALMAVISIKLTVFAPCLMGVGALVVHFATRTAEQVGRAAVEENKSFGLRLWESVNFLQLIRTHSREAYEQQRLAHLSDRIRRRPLQMDLLWALPAPISEITAVLVVGAIIAASGLGEIFFLWERRVLRNERCGCGVRFRECRFWSEVLREGFGRIAEYDARVYDAAFKRARGGRPQLTSIREARPATALFRDVAGALYSALGRKLGDEALIDSSKYPLYGAWLAQTPGIDVSVLHLFRDPRAVTHSWSIPKFRPESVGDQDYMGVSRSPLSAIWRWKWFNHWSDELREDFDLSSALISYEKFCDDPEAHLRAIADALGLEPRKTPKGEWHSVSGNPVRFTSETLEIRKDEKWRQDMARASQLVTGMLCGAQHRRLRRAAAEFLQSRPARHGSSGPSQSDGSTMGAQR